MIKTLQNFTPPQISKPYNPSKLVTVPANDSVEFTIEGRDNGVFGFDRILPYGADLLNITCTATLNDETTIFKNVQLAALRKHFLDNKLKFPYIIQASTDLNLVLTNTSGNDVVVNIELLGYDAPALNKLVKGYKTLGLEIPKPVFLTANAEIAASAQNYSVDIKTKSVDLEMYRATIVSDDDDDMVVSLQIYNETVKNSVFIQQFNDEFAHFDAMVPFEVSSRVPLSLLVTNYDGANANTLTFFGEAYVVKK